VFHFLGSGTTRTGRELGRRESREGHVPLRPSGWRSPSTKISRPVQRASGQIALREPRQIPLQVTTNEKLQDKAVPQDRFGESYGRTVFIRDVWAGGGPSPTC